MWSGKLYSFAIRQYHQSHSLAGYNYHTNATDVRRELSKVHRSEE
jgi:hypothetical protein